MNDKPKRWTWEEWIVKNKDCPLAAIGAFSANDPLIDWQEQRIKELEAKREAEDLVIEYMLEILFDEKLKELARKILADKFSDKIARAALKECFGDKK